jgi:hypothetical protein
VIVLFAGVAAVILAVAGCGGGSDSSTPSITKAQFIEKADASCKKNEEQIRADFNTYVKEHEKEALTNPTEEDFANLVDAVIAPSLEQEVEEIRALGAPKGEEDQVEAILAATEEGREQAEEDSKAAVQGSTAGLEKATKLAREFGLKACGA